MNKSASINIYTDGGSRGNPGESALGVYIEDEEKKPLIKIGKRLGIATNNIAEYSAIYEGLDWIINNKSEFPNLLKINFYMDSQLAMSQLNGLYKIKNPKLRDIILLIRGKEVEIGIPVVYSHIRREFNKNADRLVNLALDGNLTKK